MLDSAGEGDGDAVGVASSGSSLVQPTTKATVTTAIPTRSALMLIQRTAVADYSLGCVSLFRFEEVGLIDDVDFARSWVQSRQRSRGVASKVLAMELRRKGIDDETSREVLAELDPDVERQNAHRLVQKKLRSMRGLDSTTQIRRLTGMLARKGYAPQVAFDVVRAELEAVEMQEPDSV